MTQATRTLTIGAIAVVVAAFLPLVLSNYQVGLATEVLIFGILAMSIGDNNSPETLQAYVGE